MLAPISTALKKRLSQYVDSFKPVLFSEKRRHVKREINNISINRVYYQAQIGKNQGFCRQKSRILFGEDEGAVTGNPTSYPKRIDRTPSSWENRGNRRSVDAFILRQWFSMERVIKPTRHEIKLEMNTFIFDIQELSLDQIRRLYAERLKRDFPPDEIKPLARIERALARGEYICYGATDGEAILAYAFFVVAGRRALFDYFAVAKELRDRGIGGRFIRALMDGPLSRMDCVLLEVDDPDRGQGDDEVALRNRRLAFYLRNGLTDTGLRAKVYGVDFRILSLPVGHTPSFNEARAIYAELYRAILPPKLYEKRVIV